MASVMSTSGRMSVLQRSSHAGVPRPVAPLSRRSLVVKASSGGNPYDNRDSTRKSNPGGTKDANVVRKDKDDQFAYQQERLEWRRKNQGEGIEDREEPPHNNLAKDMSAERRGPEVEGTSGHGDTLKELIDNVTGKNKKKDKK